jgi:hypothetical protein
VPEHPPLLLDWGFDPSAELDYSDARTYYYGKTPDLAEAFETDFRRPGYWIERASL